MLLIRTVLHSSVIKNFFIYSCGSLLLRSASLIVAPITMTILTPADYGLLALTNSFISIFVVIIGCGLRQALSIEYFHYEGDGRKKIINDIITLYLLCGTPLLCAGMCIFIYKQNVSAYLLAILFATCCLYFFVELFYQLLQYSGNAFALTVIQTTAALCNIVGTIVFVWFFKWGVESVLLANLIGMLTGFFCAVYAYRNQQLHIWLDLKRSISALSSYLQIGLPFIPTMLLSIVLASGNRFLLAQHGTLHDVGIYALADSFGQLFHMLVLYPFSGSYHPYILTKFGQNKETLLIVEQTNQRIMYLAMATAAVCIICGYFLCKPLLVFVFPARYHEVIQYVPYILLGYVFLLGQYFASAFIQFQKCSWFLSCSLIIPALLSISLTLLFAPAYKIYGCIMASTCAYASFFIITLLFNKHLQRNLRMPSEKVF